MTFCADCRGALSPMDLEVGRETHSFKGICVEALKDNLSIANGRALWFLSRGSWIYDDKRDLYIYGVAGSPLVHRYSGELIRQIFPDEGLTIVAPPSDEGQA